MLINPNTKAGDLIEDEEGNTGTVLYLNKFLHTNMKLLIVSPSDNASVEMDEDMVFNSVLFPEDVSDFADLTKVSTFQCYSVLIPRSMPPEEVVDALLNVLITAYQKQQAQKIVDTFMMRKVNEQPRTLH